MEKEILSDLFKIIRSAVLDNPLSQEELSSLDASSVSRLYQIADAHDLAHLLSQALGELLLPEKIKSQLQHKTYTAIYRYKNFQHELINICKALCDAEIDCIPLKGSVIRDYYKHPWMRTSCDIDLLVREEDTARAKEILVRELGYTAKESEDYHDISLYSKSGVHLELHFSIKENDPKIDPVLDRVWEYAVPVSGMAHQYALTPEFFVFHHIAHMSYHFLHGGCGIRPFVDLYVINESVRTDEEKLRFLLSRGGLSKFYETALSLSYAWMTGGELSELLLQMQEYVLSGGVYGSRENRISLERERKGGTLGYVLSKMFVPYDVLKTQYPVIKKHKILTPLMQVCRWFRLLFSKKARRLCRDVKDSATTSKEKSKKTQEFLDKLGF